MEHYTIEHTESCDSFMCRRQQILFLFKGEFQVVDIPPCQLGFNRPHEFVFNAVKPADESLRMYKSIYPNFLWTVEKARIEEEEFKEHRLRGKKLRKWVYECNYIYYDNAGRGYYIVSKMPFMDKFLTLDSLWFERKDSLFQKNENGKMIVTPENRDLGEELARMNLTFIQEKEVQMTLKHFTSKLITKANETSKQ